MSLQNEWVTFLQRFGQERDLTLQLLQKIFAHVDALGDRVTQHSGDHAQIIEAFEVLKQMFTSQQRKEEKPVAATKTVRQVNDELETLRELLDTIEAQVENLGVCLPGKVKEACERYRELLFDQLPPDAPEQDVELAERNLQLLLPMVQTAKAVTDQCQRYKDDLKAYATLGTLEHVRVMYNAGAEVEKQRERFANEMRELREAQKQITEERDRARKTLGQMTQHAEKLLAERDRARKMLGQLTAQLAASIQTA